MVWFDFQTKRNKKLLSQLTQQTICILVFGKLNFHRRYIYLGRYLLQLGWVNANGLYQQIGVRNLHTVLEADCLWLCGSVRRAFMIRIWGANNKATLLTDSLNCNAIKIFTLLQSTQCLYTTPLDFNHD